MSYTLGDFTLKSKKLRKNIVDQLLLNADRSPYHKAIIDHLFRNYYMPSDDQPLSSVTDHSIKTITQPKREQPAVITFHDRPSLPLSPNMLMPEKLKRSPYLDLLDNLNTRLEYRNSSFPQLKQSLAKDKPECPITNKFIQSPTQAVLLFLPPRTSLKLFEPDIFHKSTAHLSSYIDAHMNPTLVHHEALGLKPGFISPKLN